MLEPQWFNIRQPPPTHTLVWLMREDGGSAVGWRIYDTVLGRSIYWGWTDEIRRFPKKKASRLERAGLYPVTPVAWRPYEPERIAVSSEPIERLEAEVMLNRMILTDGTMRGMRKSALQSSMKEVEQTDEKKRGAGELIGFEFINKTRFMPTPRDVQNYEDGVVMSWFILGLRKVGHWMPLRGMSEGQVAFVLRAYSYSFTTIGEEIDTTGPRAKALYKKAVDAVWNCALGERRPVRRLRREEWDREASGS